MSRITTTLRKRVLFILPREFLDKASGLERSWTTNRPELEVAMLANWDDETKATILEYLERNL